MARHKYHDSKLTVQRTDGAHEAILDTPEHHVALSGVRRFDPGSGKMSLLTEQSSGDWSFCPNRFYRRDPGYTYTTWVEDFDGGVILAEPAERRAELEAQMPTYRPPRHPRACPSCHLTTCAGPGHHELADIQDFQQRARTPHRQAGDYNRHTHDYSIP